MNKLQETLRQKSEPELELDPAKPRRTFEPRGLTCEVEVVSESASLDGEPFRLLSNPMVDGRELASACWKSMRPRVDCGFRPYLLILIASPMYLENGITPFLRAGVEARFAEHGFANLPVIVSAFGEHVFGPHQESTGALLICLASRSTNDRRVTDCAKSDWNECALFGLPS